MRRYGIRKTIRSVATIGIAGAASLFAYSSAFAAFGQPGGVTDEARDMHNLYLVTLAIAAVVFLAVQGALIYIIIRYRRGKREDMPAQIHGSNIVEFIWVGIPVAIVLALFTYTVIVLNTVERGADEDDMSVHVQGFQFGWEFTYSMDNLGPERSEAGSDEEFSIVGAGLDSPELVIPVDERVEFQLQSDDVIHSFYVVDFLYKLDLVPGRDNRFAVTPRETGVYQGYCAELCGVDHALMRFTVRVVEQDEFDDWVEEMRGGGEEAVSGASDTTSAVREP